MRILHISDTHLGAHLYVRGAPTPWRRAHDHQRALDALTADAVLAEVDLVVHTGDVFDRSRPPWSSVRAAAATWLRIARHVPLVVLPGNHDRQGLRNTVPMHHPGVHVVHGFGQVDVAGVRLALVSYQRRADAWAACAQRAWGGGADLLLCHQAFHGARVPGFRFEEGRQLDTVGERHLPTGARHVLCGHIHPRQVVGVGGAQVVHPGSTARTALREGSSPKGGALWELGRTVTHRFVEQPDRRWMVVRSPEQVDAVEPGALVRVQDSPLATDLEVEVQQRGGWLLGAPPGARPQRRQRERRQLGLF